MTLALPAPAVAAVPVARVAVAATAPPPAIALEGVRKHFATERGWRGLLTPWRAAPPGAVALDDVTLAVRRGELLGLLGPNGAGKSTLLRLLSTALLPDAGEAAVLGHDLVHEAAAVRRLLGVVMANDRTLNWRLSARENLRLFAALHGRALRTDAAAIGDALAMVALEPRHAAVPVGTLSTGLRQRVLVARALVTRPRIVLLDEPTRSLDPVSARDFRALVRERIVAALGCTVLLATHDRDEASGLCERVAVLHRGRVVATGAASALAERFGDAELAVWTTAPQHRVFDALVRAGWVHAVVRPVASDGLDRWHQVRLRLPNGHDASALVVGRLAASGLPVSRIERADVTLADLLDRTVADAGRSA